MFSNRIFPSSILKANFKATLSAFPVVRGWNCPLQVAQYAAAFKGGVQSTGKRRFRMKTETEAKVLVNTVSGSNIYKEGADARIKEDSEYPEWIWTMRLDRHPALEELEPNSKEYWETLHFNSKIRVRRLMRVKTKDTMRVGENERKKMEMQDRIKFRALAQYYYDPGWDPNDWKHVPDKRLWLKPQSREERLYADQIVTPKYS